MGKLIIKDTPNPKSTEGMPRKQHQDKNTTLPPKPTPRPR